MWDCMVAIREPEVLSKCKTIPYTQRRITRPAFMTSLLIVSAQMMGVQARTLAETSNCVLAWQTISHLWLTSMQQGPTIFELPIAVLDVASSSLVDVESDRLVKPMVLPEAVYFISQPFRQDWSQL